MAGPVKYHDGKFLPQKLRWEELRSSTRWSGMKIHFLLLFLAVCFGCGDQGNLPSTESGSCNNLEEEQEEEFTKPNSSTHPWYDFRSELPRLGWVRNEGGGSESRIFSRRDSMRFNYNRDEGWLYHGETAVIDVGYWWDAGDRFVFDDPRQLEVFVFVNFEPVDFAFIPVDPDPAVQSFPEIEEATQFLRSYSFDSYRGVPDFFTVMIPPESLGEAGAKDVRLLIASRHEPADGSFFGRRRERSSNMILYYGGMEKSEDLDLPDLEYEIEELPEGLSPHLRTLRTMLMPPNAPDYIPERFDSDETIFMNQVHNVDTPEYELDVWTLNNLAGYGSYIIALDGNEVLDEPRGFFQLPQGSDPAKFRLKVQLEEDKIHTFRIAFITAPFCREGLMNPQSTRFSNPVFLRYRRD